jgi:leucyl-tRNA synthetase
VTHETYRSAEGEWVAPADIVIESSGETRTAKLLQSGAPVSIGSVEKMSKSKRNVVDPDEIVTTYGADTARWFMLSDSPPERDVQWTEAGIEGASRFLQRIWKIVSEAAGLFETPVSDSNAGLDLADLRRASHRAVARVAEDIEALRFNRAVAQIYELSNVLAKWTAVDALPSPAHVEALREGVERLVQLVAPMMPHLAESCWALMGRPGLVADARWPAVDPALLVEAAIVLPVQVNGKRRGEISVPPGAATELVEKQALSLEAVARMLEGKPPRKVIVVPDRIVNVVV